MTIEQSNFVPSNNDMLRMIKAFSQIHFKTIHGKHAEDGIGPNKPDAPFFERIAKRNELHEWEYLEMATRLYKYRKTQLPTIMKIAGYPDGTDWISALDYLKVIGQQAMQKKEQEEELARKLKKEQREQERIISIKKSEAKSQLYNNFDMDKFYNTGEWELNDDIKVHCETTNIGQSEYVKALLESMGKIFGNRFAEEVSQEMVDKRNEKKEYLLRTHTATFEAYARIWYGKNDRNRKWPKEDKRIKITFPIRHQDFYQFFKENMGFPDFLWDSPNRCMSIAHKKSVINRFHEVNGLFTEATGKVIYCDGLKEHYADAENDITDSTLHYTATKSAGDVLIYIPKNAIEVRSIIKNCGGKWKKEELGWIIPLSKITEFIEEAKNEDGFYTFASPKSVARLVESVLEVDGVANYVESKMERIKLSGSVEVGSNDTVADMKARLAEVFPEGHELYPFQYTGVRYAELSGGRCLIGDDMGVGKTIQALAYAALHPEHHPVLVVCPANVKYNWLKEADTWLGSTYSASVVDGGSADIEDTDIVIINYDVMNKQKDALLEQGFKTIICDESHYLKNGKAARTKATLEIADKCESVLFLSGTAISNRPVELWTTLTTLRPTEWRGKFMEYAKRYCDAERNSWGYWDFKGSSNSEELHALLRDLMIRRMKKEVMNELPDKIRQYPHVTTNKGAMGNYNRLQRQLLADLNEVDYKSKAAQTLTTLTRLRHECGIMKIEPTVDWVINYLHYNDKPIIVFAHHVDVLQGILTILKDAHTMKKYKDLVNKPLRLGGISGSVNAQKRQQTVEDFQAGKIDVLLATTPAVKEGLTLTAADTVVFVEREWSPAHEEQAEDRVNRIGQDASTVWAIYLTVPRSIDEKFNNVIESKREVIKAILDGGEMGERNSVVFELLKEMVEAGDVDAKVLEGF